jgi:hypothetical protein
VQGDTRAREILMEDLGAHPFTLTRLSIHRLEWGE